MNIGPYRVVREFGRSATGNRTVAIKIIQGSDAMNPKGRIGLVHEARAAGSLRHANIGEIYHISQHEGWLYLTALL